MSKKKQVAKPAAEQEHIESEVAEQEAEQAPDAVEGADSPEEIKKSVKKEAAQDDLFTITIPVHVKIKRQVYPPGTHKVPRHIADVMIEIVDKKVKSDMSMMVGKSYLVEKLAGNILQVKQVSGDPLAKHK